MADRTITQLLVAWSQGDRAALDPLASLVYGELRQLASGYLRRERRPSIEIGTLVHEAFLRLVDQRQMSWRNRAHFFGIAALMMRRVLVEQARSRQSARRGEGALHVSLDTAAEIGVAEAPPEVLALAEALEKLGARYPQAGQVVELRYFGGLDEREIGEVLGISVPTVKRRWRMARAWLHRQLSSPDRYEP